MMIVVKCHSGNIKTLAITLYLLVYSVHLGVLRGGQEAILKCKQ